MRRIACFLVAVSLSFPLFLPALAAQTFEITGTVLDHNGVPVAMADVELLPIGKNPILAKTDANGFYRLASVPIGSPRYMVSVKAQGFFKAIKGDIGPGNAKTDFILDPFDASMAFRQTKLHILTGYLEKIKYIPTIRQLPKFAVLDAKAYPKEVTPFLESGAGVQISDSIKSLAQKIIDGLSKADQKNSIKVAKAVFDWVVNNIEYDLVNVFPDDLTCGNYQTTFGGFGIDFDEWCYTPEETAKEKRAICVEFERLTSALLRALGIPARPAPLRAHPVTQWWVQPDNGEGFWSNMQTSAASTERRNGKDPNIHFPSIPDSPIALLPIGPDAPIHMKWDFGGKLWWKEDYGQEVVLGEEEAMKGQGLQMLKEFEKTGRFTESQRRKPQPSQKGTFALYSRGFEVDLCNATNTNPVVKFPIFLNNEYREQIKSVIFVDKPESIEKIWTETEKNETTGLAQSWICARLDLAKIAVKKDDENQIENASFEDGERHWDKMVFPPDKAGVKFGIVSDSPHSGLFCAKITSPSKGGVFWSQRLDIEGPARIKIKGFIKTEGVAERAMIELVALKPGEAPKPPFLMCRPQLTGDNGWTEVSGEFDILQSTSVAGVQLTLLGQGSAFFDDIEINKLKLSEEGGQTRAGPEEYWVENPTSGVKLCTHVHFPNDFNRDKRYPAVIMLPGGNGFGTQFELSGAVDRVAKSGFVAVVFDPDGRGKTKEGKDDISGPVQQDGLRAVLKFVAGLPYVDTENLGMFSNSFGIILAACTAGRYPMDPPVKFILDWEGPDGHLCAKNHLNRWDMEFWSPREASEFIKKFPGIYIRLQSEKDHVQDDNEHALRMINGATNKRYNGEGVAYFTRVNINNSPNTTYKNGEQPKWLSENEDRTQKDEIAVKVLKEIVDMPSPYKTMGARATRVGLGRNRLGFLGPYGFPKYSRELTKKLFTSLGVKDEAEYQQRVRKELDELGPTTNRENFFLFTGTPDWKQMAPRLAGDQRSGIRHFVTLNFKRPGERDAVAKTVSEIVEYYDGDGEGDNRFGAVIKDWQIENEINMGQIFWEGTAKDYAKHLEVCYKAAKSSDPECSVVMAGEASDVKNDTYKKILEALDHNKYFDAVDIHVYGQANDYDFVERAAKTFKGYLAEAGFDENTPMWMTEYGTYSGQVRNFTPSNERLQASTFAKRAIIGAQLGLEGLHYISCVDGLSSIGDSQFFDQMGLIHNGITKDGRGAWHKRNIYWTFMALSRFLGQVSFKRIELKIIDGERFYIFDRPGDLPIYFVFLEDVSKAREFRLSFENRVKVTPLVPEADFGDSFDSIEQALPSEIVDSTHSSKLIDMLKKGPIVIEPLTMTPFPKMLGVGVSDINVSEDLQSLGLGYAKLDNEAGLVWPPRYAPNGDFDFSTTDGSLLWAAKQGLSPIISITPTDEAGGDTESTANYSSYIVSAVERYDGDGIDDAPGSPVALDYCLSLSDIATQPDPETFTQALRLTFGLIKSAEIRAKLIVGGNSMSDAKEPFWTSVIKALEKHKNDPGYPFFSAFDIAHVLGTAGDARTNYIAINMIAKLARKLLDDAGLQRVPIVCTRTATYTGKPFEGLPAQTEREQASELVRRMVTLSANKCQKVVWATLSDFGAADGELSAVFANSGLIGKDGKKLSYYTLQKLTKELANVRFAPQFGGSGLRDEIGKWGDPAEGLWGLRFGKDKPFIIAWVNGNKPPTFSTAEYDMPFSEAIEIEYLVPEGDTGAEIATPVFKTVIVKRTDNGFVIPVDRFDPFIIRPTTKPASTAKLVLEPKSLSLNPGQTGMVKITVEGFQGVAKLSAPSTKMLPITIEPKQISSGQVATLNVATDSSSKGQTFEITVTATTDSGKLEENLIIEVADKTAVNMTLWVGKKEALINGKSTEMAVPPTIVSGYTLVPVRFVTEGFSAKVNWDAKERKIELIFGLKPDGSYSKKVTLWIDKKTAQADFGSMLPAFQEYDLPVAPIIINGTTMVPLRFISEVLGAQVDWEPKEKRIDIKWWPFD